MSESRDDRLSTPFGAHLWLDIYWPSLFFDTCGCADTGLARLDEWLPRNRRGDGLAIAARAWTRLGHPAEALACFDEAQKLGGDEVEALACFVLPGGIERCARRAERAHGAGTAADAWLDATALHLDEGQLGAAREAVSRALSTCPAHAEAEHYARLLAEPDALEAWRRHESARPARRPRKTLAARDVNSLRPCRRNGWVSEQRLRRRCYLVEDDMAVLPGSGLDRLRQAGWYDYFLGTDGDFARLSPAHPLVPAEVDLQRLLAQVDEGRPVLDGATRAWFEAQQSQDRERINDTAQLVCGLATADEALVELGIEAATWLLCRAPEHAPLWHAYLAWLGHLAGSPDACDHAHRALRLAITDTLSWRLAASTLVAEGRRAEAAVYLSRHRDDPVHGHAARQLEQLKGELPPFRVHVSPRLLPRFATPPARREQGQGLFLA